MPGNARKDIVREGEIGTYHCWSRCVQRAFLCGAELDMLLARPARIEQIRARLASLLRFV